MNLSHTDIVIELIDLLKVDAILSSVNAFQSTNVHHHTLRILRRGDVDAPQRGEGCYTCEDSGHDEQNHAQLAYFSFEI